MSNEPKVDLAAMKDQIESWEFEDPRETWWKWQHQYAQAADRIEALEAEIERLRGALRGVFEEWAGSEGFIPETAPEGYLLHLTKRMADIARAALEQGEVK